VPKLAFFFLQKIAIGIQQFFWKQVFDIQIAIFWRVGNSVEILQIK